MEYLYSIAGLSEGSNTHIYITTPISSKDNRSRQQEGPPCRIHFGNRPVAHTAGLVEPRPIATI